MTATIITTAKRTFTIPAANLPWLEDKIGALGKRASKLGIVPPTIVVLDRSYSPKTGHTVVVEIKGEAPVLPGWALAAVINVIEDEGIIKTLPGVMLPEAFINVDPQYCDHCRTRRVRHDTFVLQNDDGTTFKQVGRSCLKDFIPGGHTSPDALAWYAHAMEAAISAATDAESGSRSPSTPVYTDLNQFLACISVAIRTQGGWISRKEAYERNVLATADYTRNNMMFLSTQVTDEDNSAAIAAIEWAISLPVSETETNEFLHNIAALARLGILDNRTYRIGAAIIPAHMKAVSRAARTSPLKPVMDRGYVGTVGKLFMGKAIVIGNPLTINGKFGTSHMYKFSVDGNVVIWYAKDINTELVPGKEVTLKGTVKSQDMYVPKNGGETTPQTVLNYVRVE